MSIESIIESKSEITHSSKAPEPIVLSSRVRLARNLENYPFPNWAEKKQKDEIFKICQNILTKTSIFRNGEAFDCQTMTNLEKKVLVERHLISRELSEKKESAGVVINKDQSCTVMINEEDHLRMQIVKTGFHFTPMWELVDELDEVLSADLDFAFSGELGYLTACPTNIGTALRGSVMMHLPGLVIADQIEKVIRAANQLGLAVRGIFGEGSNASGSIFQISNQQTLGKNEQHILQRLKAVLDTIIEHEKQARKKLLKTDKAKVYDKIGRAYGIVKYAHYLNSAEAMNLLSLIRLAIDFELVPERHRRMVDRLFIECQPGHMQVALKKDITPEERDACRAELLKERFKRVIPPKF